MPKSKTLAPVSDSTQASLQNITGVPPLLEGDDHAAYEALRARFFAAVSPTDIIEEIWVGDCVDLVWETLRLRRLKAKFLDSSAHAGLDKVLQPLLDYFVREEWVREWARRENDARHRVEEFLKDVGLDQEAISAQTLAVNLEKIKKIVRLIA